MYNHLWSASDNDKLAMHSKWIFALFFFYNTTYFIDIDNSGHSQMALEHLKHVSLKYKDFTSISKRKKLVLHYSIRERRVGRG